MNFFDQFEKEHIIIAHRGLRSIRAENTLEAFKVSIGKCDMFEFDVQYTKDFIPVVIHDDSLVRTTNAEDIFRDKKSFNVRDFTLEEIRELDNTSWFIQKDPFLSIKDKKVDKKEIESLHKQSISTLDEVLSFIKQSDFPANLEIKNSNFFDPKDISQDILKRVLRFEATALCIVSSFNHSYIEKMKKSEKSIKIAALFEKKDKKNLFSYLKELDVDAYHIDKSLAEKKKIEMLKGEGIYTNVYTINDKKEEALLFSKGVKGVFTDIV